MSRPSEQPFRVVIAGGGVAGLEAALALRELAGERLAITLLEPEPEFVYRPLRVREPFAAAGVPGYPVERIARELDLELCAERLVWVAPAKRLIHTEQAGELPYDALLLAAGAQRYARYRYATTLDDRILDEQLHGLIQDVEAGYTRKLACVIPPLAAWALPIYELALMTARRAHEMGEEVSVVLLTPERAPLAIFGSPASDAVQALLERTGILAIPSAHCETPRPERSQSSRALAGCTSTARSRCRSCAGRRSPESPDGRPAASSRSTSTVRCAGSSGCSRQAMPPTSRSSTAG
jgi:hypothetical protein